MGFVGVEGAVGLDLEVDEVEDVCDEGGGEDFAPVPLKTGFITGFTVGFPLFGAEEVVYFGPEVCLFAPELPAPTEKNLSKSPLLQHISGTARKLCRSCREKPTGSKAT